ncbi:MAG TPA: AfsR/SARP family transcriptional regulator [Catenuloplanes sp.]
MLGPLDLRDTAGRAVCVRRRKQRALLALLLIRTGRTVSTDEIIDALWDGCPPRSALANLHTYVSQLRHVLSRAVPGAARRPTTTTGGYRLDVGPTEYDVVLFEHLAAAGRRSLADGRPGEAAERLARALRLWQGRPLEDLEPYGWIRPFTARLEQARLAVLEDRAEARLLLGQHAELAVELAVTVEEHPLREPLWRQYLLALQGAGRRNDAMRAYDRLRRAMYVELGVEPDPTLRELHRRIRCGEPGARPPLRTGGSAAA